MNWEIGNYYKQSDGTKVKLVHIFEVDGMLFVDDSWYGMTDNEGNALYDSDNNIIEEWKEPEVRIERQDQEFFRTVCSVIFGEEDNVIIEKGSTGIRIYDFGDDEFPMYSYGWLAKHRKEGYLYTGEKVKLYKEI